jgi:tetratricopeptide (TPR) repeat protein
MDDPAEIQNSRGVALAEQGRWAEAAVCFQEALRLNPHFSQMYNNLGSIFLLQGRFTEAISNYQKALHLLPNDADVANNLAYAYQQVGNAVDAEASARRALTLRPNFAEAHNHLGMAVQALGKLDEALGHYQAALRLRPEFPQALNNCAHLQRMKGRYEESAAYLQKALRLDPNFTAAYLSLALLYTDTGEFARARGACQEALRRQPQLHDAHNMLGMIAKKEGRLDEALAHYEAALQIQPDDAQTHLNRGVALLLQGELKQGWPEYQWRWRTKKAQGYAIVAYSRDKPFWNGGPVAGKTVFVHAEQGLGDTIQFVRYLPLVKDLGATVLFGCQEPLISLLSRCAGFDQVLPLKLEALPVCDEHCPLLNLPGVFGTSLADIPAQVPYLYVDQQRMDLWRKELAVYPGRKIGIAWQGSREHAKDALRSIPLLSFARLAGVPGVSLLSLQKGYGTEQLSALAGKFAVADLGARLDPDGAFLDVAAAIMSLDLVISADTAIAHLAGALGRPVWVALPHEPDWRWMVDREDTPWYPTMRLFRQGAVGRWDDVFGRMASELVKLPLPRSPSLPVKIDVGPAELLDRIALLEIKIKRTGDAAQHENLIAQYESLTRARDQVIPASEEVAQLARELKALHQILAQTEDDLRGCEKAGDFGQRFVDLARSLFCNNDGRAVLKKKINDLLQSAIVEA